jgi:thiol:disulfide interchange protein DsbC
MPFSRFLVAIAACALLGAHPASAQTQGAAPQFDANASELAAVKQLIESKFPGAAVTNVARSPYFGLYEAQFDDRMIYTDAKVSYVVVGAIFDADTKQNLTDARLRQLNRVAWDQLPLDLAIKKVKGNGARKLAIFSDADCPYCKRLESEMTKLDNVTIYTFMFPIAQLHPDAARKSALIWCAPDRSKAWDEWFASGKLPNNKGDCATPLAKTAQLGQKYRISATPTLVFADGTMVPGAIPLDQLENELKQAETATKNQAATKP